MNFQKRHEREVSVFRNGRSQAVRIPKEFELDTAKAVMWKDPDGTIHLKPLRPKMTPTEFIVWLRAQPPITDEEWPEIEDPPPEDVDLGLDP